MSFETLERFVHLLAPGMAVESPEPKRPIFFMLKKRLKEALFGF